jgi:hypothetical protein
MRTSPARLRRGGDERLREEKTAALTVPVGNARV